MNLHFPNSYDDDHSFDDDDKVQRILNEKKRRELAERYGADLSDGDALLPADVEAEWLNYIEEFERQFEDARRISVREYLGNPHIQPVATLTPSTLTRELEQLLEFMFEHGIAVHFLCDIEESEAYRFVTEELFDEEIDDVRIPGMTANFIYEEFHPNDEYDAKIWAQDFLRSLFNRHRDEVQATFAPDEIYALNGEPVDLVTMMRGVDGFLARHRTITDVKLNALNCTINDNYATVDVATTWTSVRTDPEDEYQYFGRAHMRLKRNRYDGWDIIQAIVPGWDSVV